MKMSDNKLEVWQRLAHPNVVYGVAWNPFNKYVNSVNDICRNYIATACQDGIVRVFDISTKKDAIYTLRGHTDKVFNLAWSPHFESILVSGSDDKTARVWDVKQVPA